LGYADEIEEKSYSGEISSPDLMVFDIVEQFLALE